jgi:hypothetical protein
MRGQQHEIEAVFDFVDAILDGDARHLRPAPFLRMRRVATTSWDDRQWPAAGRGSAAQYPLSSLQIVTPTSHVGILNEFHEQYFMIFPTELHLTMRTPLDVFDATRDLGVWKVVSKA